MNEKFRQYVIRFNLKGDSETRFEHISIYKPTTKAALKGKMTAYLKSKFPEEVVNGGLQAYIENVRELFLVESGNLYDWKAYFDEFEY